METTRPAPLAGSSSSATDLAKAALRRLALDKLEPTPENYARAYRLEAGEAPADATALAALIERIVRGIERGSRAWTSARKKDSLLRVLAGSRSDAQRLQQRLTQLVASWDQDVGDTVAAELGAEAPGDAPGDAPTEALPTLPITLDEPAPAPSEAAAAASQTTDLAPWRRVSATLADTVGCALPERDGTAEDLRQELEALSAQLLARGADAPLADSAEAFGQRAQQLIAHRHHLFSQLGALCEELTASLVEFAEDDSWVQGQCQAMRSAIGDGLTGRGVRAVGDLLRDTRERQGRLREERERARDSLKGLINRMLAELDELGSQTGNFHDSVGRYADVIEKADSLESLAGVVREMVEESRTVHSLVQQTQARLQDEHHKARDLARRVDELEGEMRRLSEEVSTDQLTQVANRRGLLQAFEGERARVERGGGSLAVGLLDIDNFKRLNDELGHGAGDEALRSLAARVSAALRPTDRVARYGGEEFVVLLPDTPVAEGQQILTRLQRSLTGGLFMHESKQVFVTFSAGVTAYRVNEAIETALERADQALYEAKRTGKNRTCVA
ncbi:MAG TPA: GGDEF domain-containing protein [Burkholderiaceae bacterium]|nr:GGDEF domain-containing protein [Burkholderiaceae bacterium]